MTGAWAVLEGLAGAAAVFLFWFVVLIVIPGVIAVYSTRLFPLTGQWRLRWRERRKRRQGK
ncbi:MAG: hypothetical protein ACHQO8_03000 [Vicinamibacterales bacterium]